MATRPPAAFSDSDWTRDPPLPPRLPPAQRRALLLAVAIAVGCVGIALVLYGVEQWFDAQGRSEALHAGTGRAASAPVGTLASTKTAPASSPATARAPAAASVAAPLPAEPATERRELAALEAEMKQRARDAADQAAAEAQRRKERAWERFYQRPAFCNENPTSAQMIECANQYIRARKAFEERYGNGRL